MNLFRFKSSPNFSTNHNHYQKQTNLHRRKQSLNQNKTQSTKIYIVCMYVLQICFCFFFFIQKKKKRRKNRGTDSGLNHTERGMNRQRLQHWKVPGLPRHETALSEPENNITACPHVTIDCERIQRISNNKSFNFVLVLSVQVRGLIQIYL